MTWVIFAIFAFGFFGITRKRFSLRQFALGTESGITNAQLLSTALEGVASTEYAATPEAADSDEAGRPNNHGQRYLLSPDNVDPAAARTAAMMVT